MSTETTVGPWLSHYIADSYATSRSEAKRLISQGGIKVNGEVVKDDRMLTTDDLLHSRWILFCKGKKNFFLFTWENECE